MTILVSDHQWHSVFSGVILSNSRYVSVNGLFQTVVQMEKVIPSATGREQEGAVWIKRDNDLHTLRIQGSFAGVYVYFHFLRR